VRWNRNRRRLKPRERRRKKKMIPIKMNLPTRRPRNKDTGITMPMTMRKELVIKEMLDCD